MKILYTSDRKTLSETLNLQLGTQNTELQLRCMKAAEPTSKNLQERTIDFVLSDETKDHCGDIIRQAGWDLKTFFANPVLPWSHNYDEPPLGRWENVQVVKLAQGPALVGTAHFAKAEDYPFADTVFRLAAGGFLKGVSVGFNPTKVEKLLDEKRNFDGYEFLEQTLLEASTCTVPCNPNALVRSMQENVISKRELAELVTRRVLAEITDQSTIRNPESEIFKQLLSRLEKNETEILTLKAIMDEFADAGGQSATLPAPVSFEVAQLLGLIAEIQQTIKPK